MKIHFKRSVSEGAVLFLILITFMVTGMAQENAIWNQKQCAVCLTYDDALNVHLDSVIPVLDSLGLRGTFYYQVIFKPFRSGPLAGRRPPGTDMNSVIIPYFIPVIAGLRIASGSIPITTSVIIRFRELPTRSKWRIFY